ncbi:helix-turn-helix domain-containing protein [Aureispira sp. CCB-E]|uniref:helix-turn-helix domain-containing protein n=1 Tax=Aureispira sp. CCB-E TaxID=3051121 RepID=UPI0028691F88|nr:helix-turn-helix domain-containing protein [Aureispira sp. CCB-E]WMX15302.1 helix-turn-helix domain-containing protein [Aureispira sp. CCB-E]
MTVHERLEKVIRKSKKNANSLASEINVSHTAISRALRGETLPSSKILIPLGEKLGISIDWVLFGVGEMFMDSSKVIEEKGEKKKGTDSKNCKKELEQLKKELREKDLLIAEKTKLLEAKDKIINLLEKK